MASSTDTASSSTELVVRYFEALNDHDLETAGSFWSESGVDRFVGQQDVIGPEGVREYFANAFAAFPDFSLEVLETTSEEERVAVRWRLRGTFAGPGHFQGFAPNGAQIETEGCDVLTVDDGLISHNNAYIDSGDIARQLGFLPAAGSAAETRLAKLANAQTRLQEWRYGARVEPVADGVWIVRGGFPAKKMNVYLFEDEGGATVFDAGSSEMPGAIRKAAARFGGIRRVVLSHADADHRGAAPGLGAPVYCHPAERDAAESAEHFRSYWDYSKLNRHGRLLNTVMIPRWDGGPVQIAGSVEEGEEIAGFRVIDLPGHAPGLVGLFRERDRLAVVSDCVYTLDPQTGIKGPPRVPHPAFNFSTAQAADSVRKLAALNPSAAWTGHAEPVTGDVVSQLEQVAAAASV